MNDHDARRGSGMFLGAALMLVGVVMGAVLSSDRGSMAYAANAGAKSSLALPAVTIGSAEVALVKEEGGRFFIIDVRGNAAPVRIKDTELRNVPGESLVFSP